jgi:hypothetical protein
MTAERHCDGPIGTPPAGVAAIDLVIASEAKQSMEVAEERMDCFVASLLAMTENGIPGSSLRLQ